MQPAAVRSAPGFAGVRSEALELAVEGKGNVLSLPMPALEMPKRNRAGILAVRRQDEGVICAEFEFGRFAERSQIQPLAGVGRSTLAVLRPADGRDNDNGRPRVGELAELIHRGVDRAALVGVLARRRDALDVIQQQKMRVEGVGGRGHIREVKGRAAKRQAFRQRF